MAQFDFDTTAEHVADTFADVIKGKNVLVTGTTPGGLGAETARVIAKHANLVIVAGRSTSKLEDTIQSIKQETPAANLRALLLDLGSFAGARKAAAEVNAYPEPIHVLINNAGIMAHPFTLTPDGIESQFATNHLAPFLFTSLIFPRLVAASTPSFPARVVSISSAAASEGPNDPVDFESYMPDYKGGELYEPWLGYFVAKAANILFADEISRRAKVKGVNVEAYSVHPGSIYTNLQTVAGIESIKVAVQRYFIDLGRDIPTPKTLPNGAATHIVAAFDPSLKGHGGAYLEDSHVDETKLKTKAWANPDTAQSLWTLSEKLVGIKFDI